MTRMATFNRRARLRQSRRKMALERPELRLSSSAPREFAAGTSTAALKRQRTPEVDAAIERYLEATRRAQIGKACAREGIDLVEEGLERMGTKR